MEDRKIDFDLISNIGETHKNPGKKPRSRKKSVKKRVRSKTGKVRKNPRSR